MFALDTDRLRRALWIIAAGVWLAVAAVAIAGALALSRLAHAGETFPAHVLIYTYDGPVEYDGPIVDFAYTPTALLLTMRTAGDGIFRADFD